MRILDGAKAAADARAASPTAPPGAALGPLAVVIGSFDGMHLGHQALLAAARRRAESAGALPAILTFNPHPARVLAPARAPALIMSLGRRLELAAELGIEAAIVQPFTRDFAAIEADDFIRDVLARDLGARAVVVGYDFTFGRGRAGNPARLVALGRELGIDVDVVPPITIDGRPCSSTVVRQLVTDGRTDEAARILGRPFEIEGRVVRGAGRGRQLGFPTANVLPEAELLPKLGIYAARVRLLEGPHAGETHLVALSVGRNPTFVDTASGQSPVTVEAYLLDFDDDLYDRRLRLEVGERLRDELRFEGVAALIAQIEEDVSRVRALLS